MADNAGNRFVTGTLTGGGAFAATGNPYLIGGGALLGGFGNLAFGGESEEDKELRRRANEIGFKESRQGLTLGRLEIDRIRREERAQQKIDRNVNAFRNQFAKSFARLRGAT